MVGKTGRDGIVTAAERLFREFGYKPVSLAHIAEAAGIRKPSVYHHFPGGKEQLYVEVQLAVLHRIGGRVLAAREDAPDTLTEQLSAVLHAMIAEEPLHLLSMMHHDMPEMNEEHRRALSDASYTAVIAPIVAIVERGIAAGEARPLNAHAVAGSIVAMVEGNAVAFAAGYGGTDLMTMTNHSLDLVLHGLVVSDSSER